jgi:hypothetical protein
LALGSTWGRPLVSTTVTPGPKAQLAKRNKEKEMEYVIGFATGWVLLSVIVMYWESIDCQEQEV